MPIEDGSVAMNSAAGTVGSPTLSHAAARAATRCADSSTVPSPSTPSNGVARNRFLFEHIHAGQEHDHLVCTSCGRVVEFVSPGIAALQSQICRAHGFVPGRQSLQITGMCTECARAEQEAEAIEAGAAEHRASESSEPAADRI